MRVIAGTARSLVLVTPAGRETRPTTDRIKETLFNILQPRIARTMEPAKSSPHSRGAYQQLMPAASRAAAAIFTVSAALEVW